MMKFIKPFKGCKQGDIYPTQFVEGDECPPELEAAAIETGSVEVKAAAKPKKGAADDHSDHRTGD